jgi:hypothetical protein
MFRTQGVSTLRSRSIGVLTLCLVALLGAISLGLPKASADTTTTSDPSSTTSTTSPTTTTSPPYCSASPATDSPSSSSTTSTTDAPCTPIPLVELGGGSGDVLTILAAIIALVCGMWVASRIWGPEL